MLLKLIAQDVLNVCGLMTTARVKSCQNFQQFISESTSLTLIQVFDERGSNTTSQGNRIPIHSAYG